MDVSFGPSEQINYYVALGNAALRIGVAHLIRSNAGPGSSR